MLRARSVVQALWVGLLTWAISGGVLALQPAKGQILEATGPLPAFEVATVKPGDPARGRGGFQIGQDRFAARNMTLADLLRFAYRIKSDAEVSGLPKWAGTVPFDVAAQVEPAAMDDEASAAGAAH